MNTISPVKRAGRGREIGNECANIAGPVRRRGGQPKNGNARRHGRWAAESLVSRKVTIVRLKALSHVIEALQLAPRSSRYRIGPLRTDQVDLLLRHDPELLALVPPRFVSKASVAKRRVVP